MCAYPRLHDQGLPSSALAGMRRDMKSCHISHMNHSCWRAPSAERLFVISASIRVRACASSCCPDAVSQLCISTPICSMSERSV